MHLQFNTYCIFFKCGQMRTHNPLHLLSVPSLGTIKSSLHTFSLCLCLLLSEQELSQKSEKLDKNKPPVTHWCRLHCKDRKYTGLHKVCFQKLVLQICQDNTSPLKLHIIAWGDAGDYTQKEWNFNSDKLLLAPRCINCSFVFVYIVTHL